MNSYLFKDIVVGKEGLLKGPFGSDLKKDLYIQKSTKAYKVYLQENILKENNFVGEYYISEEYYNKKMSRYAVKEGDFIVTCDGTLGEIFQLKNISEKGIISSSLLRITLNNEIVDNDYFYYLFKAIIKRQLITQGNNSVLKHLPGLEVIRNHSIKLHNLTEQKKIGNILKKIDDKIKNNNKINSELKNMAKTIYDYWFLQFEFPNDKGNPYKSSGGKMVWNEELKKEIPEKFNRMVLKNIDGITIITGKTPSTKEEDNFGNDVMFITIEDLRKNTFIVDTNRKLSIKGANTQKNKYIPKGSICVSCIATIGEIAISTENSQTNQQINSIIAKEIKIRNYLYFCLKNIFSNFRVKSGNIFSNMNKEEFENIKILLPNDEVLGKFYESINSLFIKIEKNTKEIRELTSLRNYLLPLLMNGQIGFKD